MYETEGTLPGLTAPDRPVAWLSLALRTTRQCQASALGTGFPAPPTSRGHPRVMPVSNGECISTASADNMQGFARFISDFLGIHTIIHRKRPVTPTERRFSTVLCTSLPQATGRNPGNTESVVAAENTVNFRA
jgi:hypothetical protein